MFYRKELLPLLLVLAVIIAGLIVKEGKLHRHRLTAEFAVGMLELSSLPLMAAGVVVATDGRKVSRTDHIQEADKGTLSDDNEYLFRKVSKENRNVAMHHSFFCHGETNEWRDR